jgi:hypothetical protein
MGYPDDSLRNGRAPRDHNGNRPERPKTFNQQMRWMSRAPAGTRSGVMTTSGSRLSRPQESVRAARETVQATRAV